MSDKSKMDRCLDCTFWKPSVIDSTPVAELELSVRGRNCLMCAQITTLGQLVRMCEPELDDVKNLGRTTITEIKNKLAERGLHLWGEGQPPSYRSGQCRRYPPEVTASQWPTTADDDWCGEHSPATPTPSLGFNGGE